MSAIEPAALKVATLSWLRSAIECDPGAVQRMLGIETIRKLTAFLIEEKKIPIDITTIEEAQLIAKMLMDRYAAQAELSPGISGCLVIMSDVFTRHPAHFVLTFNAHKRTAKHGWHEGWVDLNIEPGIWKSFRVAEQGWAWGIIQRFLTKGEVPK